MDCDLETKILPLNQMFIKYIFQISNDLKGKLSNNLSAFVPFTFLIEICAVLYLIIRTLNSRCQAQNVYRGLNLYFSDF